jgi:hypothetical protein
MSWMPKAERIAAVGDGTRLNKTVAKIDLAKLRTSCQINYPESPSKYHVAPTVGGPPRPAPPRTSVDHMNPPKADQVTQHSAPEVLARPGIVVTPSHFMPSPRS